MPERVRPTAVQYAHDSMVAKRMREIFEAGRRKIG